MASEKDQALFDFIAKHKKEREQTKVPDDCLKYCYLDNEWKRLSKGNKAKVLQTIEDVMAKRAGRDPYEVVIGNLGKTRGMCDAKDRRIVISEDVLVYEPLFFSADLNGVDSLGTILHEGKHVTQQFVIIGRIPWEDTEERDIWIENIGDYIKRENNPKGYFEQPIEKDARKFAIEIKKQLEVEALKLLIKDYCRRKNEGNVEIWIEGISPDSINPRDSVVKLLKVEAELVAERKYMKEFFEEKKKTVVTLDTDTHKKSIEYGLDSKVSLLAYSTEGNREVMEYCLDLFKFKIVDSEKLGGEIFTFASADALYSSMVKATSSVVDVYNKYVSSGDAKSYLDESYKVLSKQLDEIKEQLVRGISNTDKQQRKSLKQQTKEAKGNFLRLEISAKTEQIKKMVVEPIR